MGLANLVVCTNTLQHERSHLIELGGRCRAIDETNDCFPHRPLANEAANVDRLRQPIEPIKEWLQWRWRGTESNGDGRAGTISPFHDGRDALADVIVGSRHLKKAARGVGVYVDKARGSDEVAEIDDARSGLVNGRRNPARWSSSLPN